MTNKEMIHIAATHAARVDRAGGTSTGDWAPLSREDLDRCVDLAFIRGFKVGASWQLAKDRAVMTELDSALAALFTKWQEKKEL